MNLPHELLSIRLGLLPFELGDAWNGDPIVIERGPESRVVDPRCCPHDRAHARKGSQRVSSSTVLRQAGKAVILARTFSASKLDDQRQI